MANETQDQPVSGLGAVVTPPKSKGGFSVPGNVSLDPTQTQSILANMQRIIDERESPLNLFTSGLKDALAYAAVDPTRNILARDEQKMREQRELFDIRTQMAAVKAAEEQRKTLAGSVGRMLGVVPGGQPGEPGAPGVGSGLMTQIDPAIREQALELYNQKDFAGAQKLIQSHLSEMSKITAQARTKKESYERTIDVMRKDETGKLVPDLASLIDILDNPSIYRPTTKGQEQVRSIVGTPAPAAPTAAPAPGAAPLSVRNNNPGNLRDTKTGEFLKFDTLEAGQKALDEDLKIKLSGQSPAVKQRFGEAANIMTPSLLAETWSPSTAPGNTPESTSNYAKFIADKLGIDPTAVIPNTPEARKIVANAITEFESGQKTPVAAKPAEVVTPKAEEKVPTIPETRRAEKIATEGGTEFAKGVEKDFAAKATAIDTAGQSAGDRLNRANKIAEIATDKEVKDYLGILAKKGAVPFTLKQLESGLGIGQFGTINIADLEKNLREANAPTHVIAKLRELDGYIAETKLEYAQVYLKGQGAVSDNERRLVSDAILSLKDPAARIEKQAKVMAERATFDQRMYDLYSKYRDEKGEYASFGKFLRSPEAVDALKKHKKDLSEILGVSPSMVGDDPYKSKPSYQPGSIKWEVKTRNQ
jgi:hypothetical protein